MSFTPDLKSRPSNVRGPIATGLASGKQAIDRTGGDNGAGVILGAAVITRGEALGHGMWIDAAMLKQTHDAIAAAGKNGIKARFTHPGLSSDGLGSFLGRFKNPQLDGDVVRADLHFSQSAHDTPDGDLAEYVTTLAEEDPKAFGTSIVFRHDFAAEKDFESQNQQEIDAVDYKGRPTKIKAFRSPDPQNKEHLPHARLKMLRAVDAVDSPAANPGGFFHAQDVAHEADDLISYALGLSPERPELSNFDVEPDRVSSFVSKFLDRHGLEITTKTKEAPVTTKPLAEDISPETPADPKLGEQPDPKAEFAAQLKLYTSEFGVANGSQWLADGKPIDECRKLHAASVEQQRQAELTAKDEQITKLTAERDELKTRIEQAKLGDENPVEFSPPEGNPIDTKLSNGLPPGVARFVTAQRAKAASNN